MPDRGAPESGPDVRRSAAGRAEEAGGGPAANQIHSQRADQDPGLPSSPRGGITLPVRIVFRAVGGGGLCRCLADGGPPSALTPMAGRPPRMITPTGLCEPEGIRYNLHR